MNTRRKFLSVRVKLITVIVLCVPAPGAMANHAHHIKRHHFARYHGVGPLAYPVVAVPLAVPRFVPVASAIPQTTNKIFAYPAHGQTLEQQARDHYECHAWASGQSGFDPGATGGPYSRMSANHALHTAAGGAALGAIGGAVAGDPGIGAALGGAIGGVVGLAQQTEQAAVAEQSASNLAMLRGEYNRAAAAYYVAEGYSVN